MPKPIVAIVGRPNVGKSTLVNRLSQSRQAIVHESRGVTRDRSYHETDWNGHDFILVDTGGIESARSTGAFASSIREQALVACEEADVIVLVVDGSVGVTDEDEEVARVVRRARKPTILVVNKQDNPANDIESWQYFSLGVGEPHPISATHGLGTGDLLDEIVSFLPRQEDDDSVAADILSVAIIGRPNVGKSSLANRLIGTNRSIVSELAGTTRDAIDTMISWHDQSVCLIDTAGMRKRSQVHKDVEYYSLVRGLQAMERADVCLLVVDSTVRVTEQDQKLASLAADRGCALVICLNKWDLIDTDMKREAVKESLALRMAFLSWAPSVNISALTGRGCDKAMSLAVAASAARASRVKTSELNRVLEQIRASGYTVTDKGRRLKINYATQTGSCPPVYSFWCNTPELVNDNFLRFMENRLRAALPLTGTPIRLRFRKKDA